MTGDAAIARRRAISDWAVSFTSTPSAAKRTAASGSVARRVSAVAASSRDRAVCSRSTAVFRWISATTPRTIAITAAAETAPISSRWRRVASERLAWMKAI